MKKTSPRDIPDLSPKRKPGHLLPNEPGKPGRAVPQAPRVKPKSTSAKSGRRGQ